MTPSVQPYIPTYDPTSLYNQLAFECKANMQSSYQSFVFDVRWTIDNTVVAVKSQIAFTSLKTNGTLHRIDWDQHRNKKIGLRVCIIIYNTVRCIYTIKVCPVQNVMSILSTCQCLLYCVIIVLTLCTIYIYVPPFCVYICHIVYIAILTISLLHRVYIVYRGYTFVFTSFSVMLTISCLQHIVNIVLMLSNKSIHL